MAQERDETQFDDLLGGFFADRLDAQLGKAAARFEHEVTNDRPSPWRLTPGRAIGLIGAAALAASFAWAAGGVAFRTAAPDATPTQQAFAPTDVRPASFNPQPVEQTLAWRTEDGGAFALSDGTPVRQYRRRQTTVTRWVDPVSGVRIERSKPQEQVMLVRLQTY